MNGAEEVKAPKALHPAFYGCFGWHSSVHGHRMLVRLLGTHPGMAKAGEIRAVLDENLAPGRIAAAPWPGSRAGRTSCRLAWRRPPSWPG